MLVRDPNGHQGLPEPNRLSWANPAAERECSTQTASTTLAVDTLRESQHTRASANYLERGCSLRQDHQASSRGILLRAEWFICQPIEEIGFQSIDAFSSCCEKGWRFQSRLRSYDSARAARKSLARRRGIRRLFHGTKTARHIRPTSRSWKGLPFHSKRWLDPVVSEDKGKSCLGASIQIQPGPAKA